jgi:hypothetical protein
MRCPVMVEFGSRAGQRTVLRVDGVMVVGQQQISADQKGRAGESRRAEPVSESDNASSCCYHICVELYIDEMDPAFH